MENNVIEINEQKFCSFCFSPVPNGGSCSKCRPGMSFEKALPVGTILQGKYIVGNVIYYDSSYFGYYGYDLYKKARVLIREFFPGGNFCTRDNKNLVYDASNSARVAEFKKAINNFHTEVKLMSGVKNSSSVLEVNELFDENGTSYCINVLPDNAIILAEYLQNHRGSVTTKLVFKIFNDILVSLDSLHKVGAVHGNIRPENIIIVNNKVYLSGLNYGGHTYLDDNSNPLYAAHNQFASLEQLSKSDKCGPWTDIYGLGATVYYMLTGKYPANIFERIERSNPNYTPSAIEKTPEIPDKLIPILEKMLAIKTFDRYKNLFELSRDLRKAGLSNVKIKQQKESKPKKSKAKLWIIIGASVLGAAIIGAGVWFVLFSGIKLPFWNTGGGNAESSYTTAAPTDTIDGSASPDSSTPADTEKAPVDTENTPATDNGQTPDNTEKPATETDKDEGKETDKNTDISDILADPDWKDNVISSAYTTGDSPYVLGNTIFYKWGITNIVFKNSVEDAYFNAWDISEKKDGSVMAWVEWANFQCILYVAANNGINAGTSCKNLFSDYTNVTSISFNGVFHTDFVTDMSGMFRNCTKLNTVDLGGLITKNVTDMSGMFENCTKLTSVDLSAFNTKKVTDISGMFENCTSLESVNVSSFSTIIVKNFSRMFYNCSSLKALDLNNFNTAFAEDMSEMFYGCGSLTDLDIEHFSVPATTNVSGMFDGCYNLQSINADNKIIEEAFGKTK